MKKKIKIGISVAAVIGIMILLFSLSGKEEGKMDLITQNASIGNIENSVTATGTIEPIKTVEVGTQVSGTISQILADYNSVVKKGQLLAVLDKTVLQSSLNSSKANFESARNELNYQKNNYNRIKMLFTNQSVSKKDMETAQYQYENAKSAYHKAKEEIVKAQTNLNYAMIYSPIDGVVISRSVNEGQTVAASFSTPTLFTIAQDLKKMQVIANVDEADIGQVKEGQHVSFTVDAYPDDVFEGKVTQVRLEATTNSNVVTYQVVIDAPNTELKLKPGLTANVTIFTLKHKYVVVIPAKALRFKPDSHMLSLFGAKGVKIPVNATSKTIWVKTNEGMKPVIVTTGESDGVNIEVLAGVNKGDVVVLDIKSVSEAGSVGNQATTEGESPFMPKRPGSDNKKK